MTYFKFTVTSCLSLVCATLHTSEPETTSGPLVTNLNKIIELTRYRVEKNEGYPDDTPGSSLYPGKLE